MPYGRNRDNFETIAAKRRERILAIQARLEYIDGVPVHPDPPGGHGSNSAYNTAGCRCQVCQNGAHEYYLRCKERDRNRRRPRAESGTTVDLGSVFSFGDPGTTAASED